MHEVNRVADAEPRQQVEEGRAPLSAFRTSSATRPAICLLRPFTGLRYGLAVAGVQGHIYNFSDFPQLQARRLPLRLFHGSVAGKDLADYLSQFIGW
jgi:hypothetical protein